MISPRWICFSTSVILLFIAGGVCGEPDQFGQLLPSDPFLASPWEELFQGPVINVTPICKTNVRKYVLCTAISSLYTICSSEPLLNSSSVQSLLGCRKFPGNASERMHHCQLKCLAAAGDAVKESISGPCETEYQAMHGFSGPIDLLNLPTFDPETEFNSSMFLPLPNVKDTVGLTVVKYGDPDKCAQIPMGMYCLLSGSFSAMGTKAAFFFGICLPNNCTEEELQSLVAEVLGNSSTKLSLECNFLHPLAPASHLSQVIGWGGVPVEYTNKIPITFGFWVMLGICLLFLALVAAGTAMDGLQEAKRRRLITPSAVEGGGLTDAALPLARDLSVSRPRSSLQNLLNHWSLLRNGRSFLRCRPASQNTFACMDAVRTFSMAQVILGHSLFYILPSTGFGNMEQFSPPHGLLGTFWFQVIPGCFYGVDSFFVLSGFLCAYNLDKKVLSTDESTRPDKFSKMYLMFLLNRFLRLVPLEMFCIFFATFVLPQMGSGILWNATRPGGGHCFDASGGGQNCVDYWWTNLFFLQDVGPYTGRCFGHTWYLANDFQIYMVAPFFSLAYRINKRLGWSLLGATLAMGIGITLVQTYEYDWVPEIVAGGSKGFSNKFYFKPWCRAPAFIVGMAVGWLWPFLERFKGRHVGRRSTLTSYAWSIGGVVLCSAATFGRMLFFQCDIATCSNAEASPVPRLLQYMWGAFSILTWCIGLAIIMVLCFLNRFLPLFQGFLHLDIWQSLAKLTYATYLIHPCILILSFCQRAGPVDYSTTSFAFDYISFLISSLAAALVLFMVIEKPLANLQMQVLGGNRD